MSPYGWATGNISIAKASTAVMFNQSTDAVAQWGGAIPGFASSLATMTAGKFIMAAGGWPIRLGGATIGGIGVSGGNAPGRDDDIARAGLAAVEAYAPAIPMQPAPTPAIPAQPVQPVPAPAVEVVPQSQATASFQAFTPPERQAQQTIQFQRSEPAPSQYLAPDQENPYGSEEFNQSDADRPGEHS